MPNRTLKGFFSEVKAVPPILNNSYYPSLDGLRAVAIVLVVFLHLRYFPGYFYDMIFNGALGVVIFFVISGFLITTLCLKEKVTTKDISLKNFYIRRVLRIFPVAYLYIIVIIILNYFFTLHISYISILGAALYVMNFSSIFRRYYSSYLTGHFWSLSVEEQFYIFVPFILKKSFKMYLILLLFIAFAMPFIVCLQFLFTGLNNIILYSFTHYLVKFQAIAIGCLFSVVTFKYPEIIEGLCKNKLVFNIAAILVLFLIQYNDNFNFRNIVTGFISSLLTGYIIVTNLAESKDFIFKFLNLKIMKTVGVLSYSLYIWQEIFTSKDPGLPGFMVNFPWNLICMIIVTYLSYHYYERFFLKLKTKFTKVRSRGIATV
jgi:peptidoglycan/LPS O-acetylase OafA/YrhL